jgi:hypothetical protein
MTRFAGFCAAPAPDTAIRSDQGLLTASTESQRSQTTLRIFNAKNAPKVSEMRAVSEDQGVIFHILISIFCEDKEELAGEPAIP